MFKYMTTRCVHLDVLHNMDTDSFLMSLRRFVARRGTPFDLLSEHGTNIRGGESELQASFQATSKELQTHLAKRQICFQFNPPNAPHFGGTWERQVKSVKAALYVTLGAQTVTKEVFRTVLIEVEGILNAKPLGYVSTDVANADPWTTFSWGSLTLHSLKWCTLHLRSSDREDGCKVRCKLNSSGLISCGTTCLPCSRGRNG